ncbi:CarD family transcriptional regulator [Virgibacillus sp. YIM 98842]|uniref:CarD family transcriptional regulator n=1 Tax=Virgibacillus sp. YIM 98842 TaxID=2663533 RepID=UPI0013DBF32C|nr:CarD family transcriptional regulator [Virgibacillus sp. YIM 98842]
MYQVGDLIIYSTHGLCKIEDISEKNIGGVSRTYYVMHPIEDAKLTISIPKAAGEKNMQSLMNKEEAQLIMESFRYPGIPWVEDARDRHKKFSGIVKTGERKEISRVANSLMRKEDELHSDKKRLSEQDRKLLESIQNILFQELAVSLDKPMEEIAEEVHSMIKQKAV